jgi:hypothetical protein
MSRYDVVPFHLLVHTVHDAQPLSGDKMNTRFATPGGRSVEPAPSSGKNGANRQVSNLGTMRDPRVDACNELDIETLVDTTCLAA